MNTTILLTAGILFLAAALFLLGYFLVHFRFQKNKKEKKSLRNCFGYEIYSSLTKGEQVVLASFLILSVLSLVGGLILYFFSFCSSGYRIALGISFLISVLCLTLTNFRSLNSLRARITISLIGFLAFDYGTAGLARIRLLKSATYQYERNAIPLVLNVFYGIIAVLGILCFFNPKFYSWFKRNKFEENGTTVYEKQKWNFYAFYEWRFRIGNILSGIFLAVSCFLSLQ